MKFYKMKYPSIHNRFLVYFCFLSLFPILTLGAVSYFINYNTSKESAINYSEVIVHQSTQKVDEFLSNASNAALLAVEEPAIQEALRNPLSNETMLRYNEELTLNKRLQFIQGFYSNIDGIYVIGENGGKYRSNYRIIQGGDLTRTDTYQKLVSQDTIVWFPANKGSPIEKYSDDLTITGGIRIRDNQSGHISGVVYVSIQESVISNIVNAKLGESGFIYIVDENNRLITHPDKGLISASSDINILTDLQGSDRGNSIVIEEESSVSGWKVIGVIPASELTKDSEVIGWIIMVILFLVCLLAIIFAYFIFHNVVSPIREMTTLMKRVEEGDLEVAMPIHYRNEVGHLSNGFNIMIRRLKQLMEKVYKEQELLRKAEVKSLQYQINPHFLYNTLDSIVWLARAKKNDEVIQMILAMTKLFRIGISRGNDTISIKEEIEHAKSYLTIQKMRYLKILEYNIEIPDSIMNYSVLKVVLQPLIENAIYHGLKMKKEKGLITITAKEYDNQIIFIVKDTGLGMTEEQLILLNEALYGKSDTKSIYGIRNVNERLKLYYGENYGLNFKSVYQEGTTVEVIIPKSYI